MGQDGTDIVIPRYQLVRPHDHVYSRYYSRHHLRFRRLREFLNFQSQIVDVKKSGREIELAE